MSVIRPEKKIALNLRKDISLFSYSENTLPSTLCGGCCYQNIQHKLFPCSKGFSLEPLHGFAVVSVYVTGSS